MPLAAAFLVYRLGRYVACHDFPSCFTFFNRFFCMKSAVFVLLYSPWALIIVDRLAALELAVDVTAGTLFDSEMRYVARSLPGFYSFYISPWSSDCLPPSICCSLRSRFSESVYFVLLAPERHR